VDEVKRIVDERGTEFDHIVATRFLNTKDSPFVKIMKWDDVMNSESAIIDPYVEGISEKVFSKNLYSCFVPEFEDYLNNNKITKIYIAGIDTDCCVLKSAADCFEHNISVEVLMNACASTGGPQSDKAGKLVLERLIGKSNVNSKW
jgi:nicotinamidase-related amidase